MGVSGVKSLIWTGLLVSVSYTAVAKEAVVRPGEVKGHFRTEALPEQDTPPPRRSPTEALPERDTPPSRRSPTETVPERGAPELIIRGTGATVHRSRLMWWIQPRSR